ncbi:hypothetical protein Tco_0802938 [Tanacetum coccineum]|uniref:Uncharacterized protein n=1 Tax=Tanacetum coccineum TaxID=301880 RepID=A0ABQ5A077_9ASTR
MSMCSGECGTGGGSGRVRFTVIFPSDQWKTNDESGTPRSQSGWKTSWDKKDDKKDQCASRVEDSSNTNQWGKKEAGSSPPSSGKWAAKRKLMMREAGSSPPSSGKWAAKRKLMMRVGPLVLSLDGKLLGTRRMTKKINVHPEWTCIIIWVIMSIFMAASDSPVSRSATYVLEAVCVSNNLLSLFPLGLTKLPAAPIGLTWTNDVVGVTWTAAGMFDLS